MRGDVRALQRLERQDRSADRSASLLKRKLDKKARNRRAARRAVRGRVVEASPSAFAPFTTLLAHGATAASRKTLLKCKDARGKRVFYVSELLADFEATAALIVAPRSAEATPLRLFRELAGSEAPYRTSAKVALIDAEAPLALGGCEASRLMLSKLRLPDGQTLFFADLSGADGPTVPPLLLGLDADTHRRVVKEVARMAGVQLEGSGLE